MILIYVRGLPLELLHVTTDGRMINNEFSITAAEGGSWGGLGILHEFRLRVTV